MLPSNKMHKAYWSTAETRQSVRVGWSKATSTLRVKSCIARFSNAESKMGGEARSICSRDHGSWLVEHDIWVRTRSEPIFGRISKQTLYSRFALFAAFA
jgi:hypothetical protein